MLQNVTQLAGKLAQLQRQRDDAFADAAFAREEARVAANSGERALAAAAAAQRQLQTERDAVMQSLTELQVGMRQGSGEIWPHAWRCRGSQVLRACAALLLTLLQHEMGRKQGCTRGWTPGVLDVSALKHRLRNMLDITRNPPLHLPSCLRLPSM